MFKQLFFLKFIACFLFINWSPSLALANLEKTEPLSLEQFLSSVKNQNLNLKVEKTSAQAAKEASAGISLPAPMIGITQIQDQSGNANGLEISQTIPLPSALSHEHSARESEAKTKGATSNQRQREVLSEAKLLYFNLWKSQERLTFLQEKKVALLDHLKLARATTRSDSFLKIHTLKVEVDLDLLENEITQSELENREKQIQLAELINRDEKNFHPLALEFPESSVPNENLLKSPLSLEIKRHELESLKAREQVARGSWFPEISLRYRQMGGTQMNPRFSEAMIGITLPFVFFWEPQASSGKAAAETLQGEFSLSQEQRQVETKRSILIARALSFKKQLTQLKEKLLPKAENRMRLVRNLAPRDLETLQDHREAMEAYPELKLKTLEMRGQYEETISALEKFISGDSQ